MVRALLFSLVAIMSSNVFAAQDPTAPLGWLAAPVKPKQVYYNVPELQSILCRKEAPCSAILNNKIVSAGESINGYHVYDINDKVVTLTRGSKTWHLELFTQVIKQ